MMKAVMMMANDIFGLLSRINASLKENHEKRGMVFFCCVLSFFFVG